MLFRFFKPKWQNQKPEVRIRAIQEISTDTPDSYSILKQLATTDPDQAVRQTATSRLTDLDLLVSICKKEQHEKTVRTAYERICALIADEHTNTIEQRKAALGALNQPNLLTHIILKTTEQVLQITALEKLSDQDSLSTIVRSASLAQIRRLAAEQLTDQTLIETLNKETLGKDKGVNRILRNKLSDIQRKQQAQDAITHRCEELCHSIEQLATCEYFPQYGAKLGALSNEWNRLASSAEMQIKVRTTTALETSTNRLNQIKAKEEAERLAASQATLMNKQQDICLSQLSELRERLIKAGADITVFNPEEGVRLEEIQRSWSQLSVEKSNPKSKTFLSEVRYCNTLLTALNIITKHSSKISGLIEKSEKLDRIQTQALDALNKQCQKLIKDIAWPDQVKPASVVQLEEVRNKVFRQLKVHQTHSQSQLDRYKIALDDLENAIQEGQSKNTDRLLKQAEQISTTLGKDRSTRLDHRFKLLAAQVAEIKEWQGYAVAPKKEALCTAMEALVQSTLEPQQQANRIRELQQQWKLLDSTDSVHSHATWKRFKKAADLAYKPCEAHFNSQKATREKNLQHRYKLCEKLSTYRDSIEWSGVNWKELEGSLKQAKREWREYSPVDRSPGKKVQSQFNELITSLEAPLKSHRQENATLKQNLIKDVQSLLEQDDLSSITDQVKDIQSEWRSIGPTIRSKEQALWQKFHTLCNDAFDRYHQSRREQSELQTSASLQIEAVCQKLEAAQETLCGLNTLRALTEYSADQFETYSNQIPSSLSQRFQDAFAFIQIQRNTLEQLHDERFQSLQRKSVLCEQLEMALLESDATSVLPEIYAAWQEHSALPSEAADMIQNRFDLLCSLCEQPQEILSEQLVEQETTLRQLCIRLEIALGQPSPAEDQALRMEYQMQRLQQALAQQEEALNLKAVKALYCEWLCIPFSNHYPELCQRFENLTDSLH